MSQPRADGTESTRGGLRQELSRRQMTMIAIGGAIGTGLFLGSGEVLSIAGPGAILAYVVAGLVALAVAYATAEMVLAHPAAGGFGALVHRYLGHWAGFVVRWIYWTGMVTSAGSDAVAAGLYVQYWWPEVPLWAMAVLFSVLIFGINAFAVRVFGEAEYWFSMIKVTAILAFIVLGALVIAFGLPEQPAVGTENLTAHGGFLPLGISGVWVATSIVVYSYGGTEGIAVMAAESQNPERDMPRVARGMVLRLALFYVLSVAIIVTLIPWNQISGSDDVRSSPFVEVFTAAGVPAAATIFNFVVLTAALSSANANMYLATRMTHSLALDRYAPAWSARVTPRGIPRNALLLSAVGPLVAVLLAIFTPNTAWLVLVSVLIFGIALVWIFIMVTHVRFRQVRARQGMPALAARLWGTPFVNVLVVLFLVGVLASGFFSDALPNATPTGLVYVALLSVAYVVVRRWTRRSAGSPDVAEPDHRANAVD